MYTLGAGKKANVPAKVFVPQKPAPKPQQVASLTGDNTKVNSQVSTGNTSSESIPVDQPAKNASKPVSENAKVAETTTTKPQLPSTSTATPKPPVAVVVTSNSSTTLPSTSSSSTVGVSKTVEKKTPAFAPRGSKAVSFAPLSPDKVQKPIVESVKESVVAPASDKTTENIDNTSQKSGVAKGAVFKPTPKVNSKAVHKTTSLSKEHDDDDDHEKIMEATFGQLASFTNKKAAEAPRQENSLQAKMPKKRKIATDASEVASNTAAPSKTTAPQEEEEETSNTSKTKKPRTRKVSVDPVQTSSSSSGSNSKAPEPTSKSMAGNSSAAEQPTNRSTSNNPIILYPSSSSSGKQGLSSSVSSSSSSSKKKKPSKATQSYSIFPISFGTPISFKRIRAYLKLTLEGVEGLVFKSVDNIPVLSEIDASFNNSYGLEVNDVVVSVNNLDARYTTFDHVMQALILKADESRGAIGTSSIHLMNGNNSNISEGTGIIQKNAVVSSMACIVFARPQTHLSATL